MCMSMSAPNSLAISKTMSMCLFGSGSRAGIPPTASAPASIALLRSSSAPPTSVSPSWGKATIWMSTRAKHSSFTLSRALSPVRPTMGSTSTWVLMVVVPLAAAISATLIALPATEATVNPFFTLPMISIASPRVPDTFGASLERRALSRCMWASTNPGEVSLPPASISESPEPSTRPLTSTILPPSTAMSLSPSSPRILARLTTRCRSKSPVVAFMWDKKNLGWESGHLQKRTPVRARSTRSTIRAEGM